MRHFFFLLFCILLPFSVLGSDKVLSSKDIKLYKEIFELQKQGNISEAQKKEKQLQNPILMGYVLYERYYSRSYKTKKQEISNWLEKYSDHPIASDIYALGKQKKIQNLPRPKGLFGGNTKACDSVPRIEPLDLVRKISFSYSDKTKKSQAQKKLKKFIKYLSDGKTLMAKRILDEKETQKLFKSSDFYLSKMALGFSYFLDNEDALAWEQVNYVLDKAHSPHPFTYWLAGLLKWKEENFEESGSFFKKAAKETSEDSLKIRASFWAARAYLRAGKYTKVGDLLEDASNYPRYFYGILALRALGKDLNHVWDTPSLPESEVTADFSHPALERFYALRALGRKDWAAEELSKLYLDADDEAKGILVLISEKNGFRKTLQNLTGVLSKEGTRYPVPDWIPDNEWQLDKALVYAFVRQESCFNHRAQSSVGATGLMQIMPSTGKALAKEMQCSFSEQKLKNPEYNLALGQTYLQKLLNLDNIQNNLIKTAVAYNAGPGNLAKWEKKMNYQTDPLMFLESLPSKETRSFIEKILVNYWVYQDLMNQPLDSLDNVISGGWPIYQSCEKRG